MGGLGETVEARAYHAGEMYAHLLGALCRASGYDQQALYCYGKIYKLDPTNVGVLWDRAMLAKEIGELKVVSSPM